MSLFGVTSQAIPSGVRNGKPQYIATVSGFDINQIIIYWDPTDGGWYCKNYPSETITIAFLNNPGQQPINTSVYYWNYVDSSYKINLSNLVCTDNICVLYFNAKYAEAVGLTTSVSVP